MTSVEFNELFKMFQAYDSELTRVKSENEQLKAQLQIFSGQAQVVKNIGD